MWELGIKAGSSGRVAILISDKIDFEPKVVKEDMEGHFILIKGKIYPECSIPNFYTPNARMNVTHICKRHFTKTQSTH